MNIQVNGNNSQLYYLYFNIGTYTVASTKSIIRRFATYAHSVFQTEMKKGLERVLKKRVTCF